MKKTFRKIHLWLSVPFGIFITLICFSGAMLVFEKEVTEWCRHDLYFVKEVKEKPLPIDSLMRRVSATLPDSVAVTGVTVLPDAERTWQVSLSKPRRASLYVDPYTGEVTGRSERLPFYDAMFHLHRWMMGTSSGFGKLLVGISTLMLVIILLTGILMWLTNRKKPLQKSLTISFTRGLPRFWHDLHVAGGIYATLFLLAIALTGLTWSFSWYRTGFYSMFGVEASAGEHGNSHTAEKTAALGENGREHRSGGRRGEHKGMREDHDTTAVEAAGFHRGGRHRHERNGEDGYVRHHRPEFEFEHTAEQQSVSPFAHWQEVYDALAESHPGYRQITVSDGSASVVPAGRNSLRAGDRFDFDIESGKITGSTPYSEQDKSTHVRSAVYTVHVGSWGGLFTRIITFFAVLLGATLPLTGYYLWIRRLVNKSKQKQRRSEA